MLLNYVEWEEGFEYMEVVVYFIIHRMFMEGLRTYQDSTCNSGSTLNCNIQVAVLACIYLHGDMNTIHVSSVF